MHETPQLVELAFADMQIVPEIQHDGATVVRQGNTSCRRSRTSHPSRRSSCRPAVGRDRIRRRPLGNWRTTPRQPPSRMPSPTPSVVSYSSCLLQPRESTRLYTESRGLRLPDGTQRLVLD